MVLKIILVIFVSFSTKISLASDTKLQKELIVENLNELSSFFKISAKQIMIAQNVENECSTYMHYLRISDSIVKQVCTNADPAKTYSCFSKGLLRNNSETLEELALSCKEIHPAQICSDVSSITSKSDCRYTNLLFGRYIGRWSKYKCLKKQTTTTTKSIRCDILNNKNEYTDRSATLIRLMQNDLLTSQEKESIAINNSINNLRERFNYIKDTKTLERIILKEEKVFLNIVISGFCYGTCGIASYYLEDAIEASSAKVIHADLPDTKETRQFLYRLGVIGLPAILKISKSKVLDMKMGIKNKKQYQEFLNNTHQ